MQLLPQWLGVAVPSGQTLLAAQGGELPLKTVDLRNAAQCLWRDGAAALVS
jgi:hypothetical protein